jgi:hypothetical protein
VCQVLRNGDAVRAMNPGSRGATPLASTARSGTTTLPTTRTATASAALSGTLHSTAAASREDGGGAMPAPSVLSVPATFTASAARSTNPLTTDSRTEVVAAAGPARADTRPGGGGGSAAGGPSAMTWPSGRTPSDWTVEAAGPAQWGSPPVGVPAGDSERWTQEAGPGDPLPRRYREIRRMRGGGEGEPV